MVWIEDAANVTIQGEGSVHGNAEHDISYATTAVLTTCWPRAGRARSAESATTVAMARVLQAGTADQCERDTNLDWHGARRAAVWAVCVVVLASCAQVLLPKGQPVSAGRRRRVRAGHVLTACWPCADSVLAVR